MNCKSEIKKYKNSKQGFSLIEIMVAVALFVTVMLIGVGSLLSLIDANRKAQAINSVMNNLNFALESMSRNLRVGTDYNCSSPRGGDCTSGGTIIYFTSSQGENMIYQYIGSRIERKKGTEAFAPITAPEVMIDDLVFLVQGTSPLDDLQPRIVIKIRGTAGVKDKIKTSFNLQTAVSQRVLDL